jgi:hypothetical protein
VPGKVIENFEAISLYHRNTEILPGMLQVTAENRLKPVGTDTPAISHLQELCLYQGWFDFTFVRTSCFGVRPLRVGITTLDDLMILQT